MVPWGFSKNYRKFSPVVWSAKANIHICICEELYYIDDFFFLLGVIGVYSEWNFIKHRKQRHLAAKKRPLK